MGFYDLVHGKKRGEEPQGKVKEFSEERSLEKSNYEPAQREVRRTEKKPGMVSRVIGGIVRNSGGKTKHGNFLEINAENPRTAPSHLNAGFDSLIPGSLHIDSSAHSSAIDQALYGYGKGKSAIDKALGGGFNMGRGHPALTSFGSLDLDFGHSSGSNRRHHRKSKGKKR